MSYDYAGYRRRQYDFPQATQPFRPYQPVQPRRVTCWDPPSSRVEVLRPPSWPDPESPYVSHHLDPPYPSRRLSAMTRREDGQPGLSLRDNLEDSNPPRAFPGSSEIFSAGLEKIMARFDKLESRLKNLHASKAGYERQPYADFDSGAPRCRPTGWDPPFQTFSHRVGETRAPPLPEPPLYRKSPYTDLDSSYEQPRQSDRPPQQSNPASSLELPLYVSPGAYRPLQPPPVTSPLLAVNPHPQAVVPNSLKKEEEELLDNLPSPPAVISSSCNPILSRKKESLLEDDASKPTWEPIEAIGRQFPEVRLVDKAIFNGGGVDTRPPTPDATAEQHAELEHAELEHAELDHAELEHAELEHAEQHDAALPEPPPQRSSSCLSMTSHCRSAASLPAIAAVPSLNLPPIVPSCSPDDGSGEESGLIDELPPPAMISPPCSPGEEETLLDGGEEVDSIEEVKKVVASLDAALMTSPDVVENCFSENGGAYLCALVGNKVAPSFPIHGKEIACSYGDLHVRDATRLNPRSTSLDTDARLIPPRNDTPCLSILRGVNKIFILAWNSADNIGSPLLIFDKGEKGRHSAVRYVFDPGGDA